eukprot:3496465-Pyramimonas_sp.AAC.1
MLGDAHRIAKKASKTDTVQVGAENSLQHAAKNARRPPPDRAQGGHVSAPRMSPQRLNYPGEGPNHMQL